MGSLALCALTVWYSPPPSEDRYAFRRAHPLSGLAGMLTGVVVQVFLHTSFKVAVHLVVTTVALVAVMGFGCPALSLAFAGQTMLERNFPMKEYVQIKEKVYCPLGNGFYSRGWRQNLRDILGPSWYIRLALPTKG